MWPNLDLPDHPNKTQLLALMRSFEKMEHVLPIYYDFPSNRVFPGNQKKPFLALSGKELHMDEITAITHPDDIVNINEKMYAYALEAQNPAFDCEVPYITKLFGRLKNLQGIYINCEFSGVILEFYENGLFKKGLGIYQNISDVPNIEERIKLTRQIETLLLKIKPLYHSIVPVSLKREKGIKIESPNLRLQELEEPKYRIERSFDYEYLLSQTFSSENINSQSYKLSNEELKFIDSLLLVLELHFYKNTFSIDAFSDHLSIGRTQLFRKTKKFFNASPSRILQLFRLKKAASFLQQGMNVNEIAFQVGFEDASYFTKCFKKQFNVTPSEYKRT